MDSLHDRRFVELTGKIKELGLNIKYADRKDPDISSKGVDWHLDHSLKVIIRACKYLKTSDPSAYVKNVNPSRIRFFTAGYLPRGAAKAPKYVLPPEEIQIKDIYSQLSEVKLTLLEIKSLKKDCHFDHPYFGLLNLKLAVEFFVIHTDHHLKIIKDILRPTISDHKMC